MSDFVLRRSEIASRVCVCEGCTLVSHTFLCGLLECLDSCVDVGALGEALCDFLSRFVSDMHVIRTQLSLVPVDFVYEKEEQYKPYKSPQNQVLRWLVREGSRISMDSVSFPESVLPVPVSELRKDMVVWCLYPVELAQQYDLRQVFVWSEADSLVDWLLWVYQVDSASVHCEVSREADGDVLWHFSIVSQSAAETHSVSRVQSLEGTPKDKILAFIREHDIVSFSELRSQAFIGRSRLFEILGELITEDKILRKKNGFYKAL